MKEIVIIKYSRQGPQGFRKNEKVLNIHKSLKKCARKKVTLHRNTLKDGRM